MRDITICNDRLKNIIVSDRVEKPMRIERILKSEILCVMRNYFEITGDDIDLSILIREDGRYDIQINILSRKIKMVNSFDN